MRNWREFLKTLTSSPLGYSADGRRLGIGLAAAMEKQRQLAVRDVEDHLRTAPAERVKVEA
jgi:hypothetical protein